MDRAVGGFLQLPASSNSFLKYYSRGEDVNSGSIATLSTTVPSTTSMGVAVSPAPRISGSGAGRGALSLKREPSER